MKVFIAESSFIAFSQTLLSIFSSCEEMSALRDLTEDISAAMQPFPNIS